MWGSQKGVSNYGEVTFLRSMRGATTASMFRIIVPSDPEKAAPESDAKAGLKLVLGTKFKPHTRMPERWKDAESALPLSFGN